MNEQKTVAIYARVSTGRQTVDMQIRELEEYVARKGWRIRKTYQDQGYTGKNTKRPAFSQMMDDARRRLFDVLLVWKLDRLGPPSRI